MVTTTAFLARVKSAALVPTHQITYQDQDIFELANEEMDNLLIPLIMSLREEYLVTKTIIPMVIGEYIIPIPERAVGRTIRSIKVSKNSSAYPEELTRASISESFAFNTNPSAPRYHYFEGDVIKINPIPDQVYGDYHLWWECRPSRLVPTVSVGIITSVTPTSVIVQQNLNTAITTGSVIDITKVKAGYSNIYQDLTVGSISTGIGPKVLVLSGFSVSNPITGVSVGDHISLAFTSDIIQLPDEALVCLVQATALRMLQGLEQTQQYALTSAILERNLASLKTALTPRNEGSSIKVRIHCPTFGPGRRSSIF